MTAEVKEVELIKKLAGTSPEIRSALIAYVNQILRKRI
jgi:hypothetical protein